MDRTEKELFENLESILDKYIYTVIETLLEANN